MGVLDALPTIPGVPPPAANAGATGNTFVKGYFSQPVPLWVQTFLTGIAPFLTLIPYVGPVFFSLFSTFGANGANLLLSGSMGWAIAKFGFNMACRGAYLLITLGFPGRWWLPYIKSFLYYANPWYVFDIVQRYSESFAEEGYKIPFANMYLNANIKENQDIKAWNAAQRVKILFGDAPDPAYPKCLAKPLIKSDIGFKEPHVDLSGNIKIDLSGNPLLSMDASGNPIIRYGYMSPMLFGMMLLYIWPWLTEMSSLFPPTVQAIFDPWVSFGISLLGGVMALVTALGAGSLYAAPGALSELGKLFPSMSGGGKPSKKQHQHGGIKFPDINDVIHNVLDNTKDIPEQQPQAGGGGSDASDENIVFLGSLAIVSLAGISIALIRNKNLSRATV